MSLSLLVGTTVGSYTICFLHVSSNVFSSCLVIKIKRTSQIHVSSMLTCVVSILEVTCTCLALCCFRWHVCSSESGHARYVSDAPTTTTTTYDGTFKPSTHATGMYSTILYLIGTLCTITFFENGVNPDKSADQEPHCFSSS